MNRYVFYVVASVCLIIVELLLWANQECICPKFKDYTCPKHIPEIRSRFLKPLSYIVFDSQGIHLIGF